MVGGDVGTMEDVYEGLVRWYLRFNGYLSIENFVIHEPAPSAETVPQGGEIDTLAVRFPHSSEVILGTPKKQIVRDARLDCPSPDRIDCLVAEIKGGERIRLNSIWRDSSDKTKGRVQYIIRWLGCLQDEEITAQIGEELQKRLYAEHGPYSFRVVLFARRRAPQNLPNGLCVITFDDIMRFIVTSRANSWLELGVGTRSRHSQWSEFVNELWTLAGPENGIDADRKITQMMELLDRANRLRESEMPMRVAVRKLMTSQMYAFDERLRSSLPREHGLYIIYDCASPESVPIRAGRTKSGTGGLKQRVYGNHFMGDQKGNLRQQLVCDHICADLLSAKTWIKNRCRVQFLTIADDAMRKWSEHYMLAVIRPRYCD